MIQPQWRERLARAGLNDAAELLDAVLPGRLAGRWEMLTKPGLGGRERWRWVLDDELGGTLYLKRYLHTPLTQQLDRIRRQSAGHSRAWWEYHQSVELARCYVSAARAVGVAEEMCAVREVHSAVLFEGVPGEAFDRVWPELAARRAPATRGSARQELTRCLARFVSAFHQTGMCHRDLYLCHIFADLDPTAVRPPRFTLIDLARTHRPRLCRLRWIIKDLSQLDCSAQQIGASRTDRLRFLVTYLGLESDAPRVRYYARRIVRKSSHILQRVARKGPGP